MIFVELIMDPYDAPAAVIISSNKGAELDTGLAARNTAKACSCCRTHRTDTLRRRPAGTQDPSVRPRSGGRHPASSS